MMSDFSIAYNLDKALIHGSFVPAGTVACMALNIPKDTISFLESLYKMQKKEGSTTELRDSLYSLDCISGITDLLPDDCMEILDQLICFRAYIRHFLQRYDTAHDPAEAWASFLEKLDELVSQARNMDNYARTVLEPNLTGATVVCEVSAGRLCERYMMGFGQVLMLDLMRSLQYGRPPRLCPCCGRWFIPSRGDEVYCDMTAPDSGGRKCREVGASRMFSKRTDSNQPLALCRAACSRIYTRKSRGQLTAEQAAELTAECRRLRDLAVSGEISVEKLEKQLEAIAGSAKSRKSE